MRAFDSVFLCAESLLLEYESSINNSWFVWDIEYSEYCHGYLYSQWFNALINFLLHSQFLWRIRWKSAGENPLLYAQLHSKYCSMKTFPLHTSWKFTTFSSSDALEKLFNCWVSCCDRTSIDRMLFRETMLNISKVLFQTNDVCSKNPKLNSNASCLWLLVRIDISFILPQ